MAGQLLVPAAGPVARLYCLKSIGLCQSTLSCGKPTQRKTPQCKMTCIATGNDHPIAIANVRY
jgi:hypothetical protein